MLLTISLGPQLATVQVTLLCLAVESNNLPIHWEMSVAPRKSVVVLPGQRKQKFSDLLGW